VTTDADSVPAQHLQPVEQLAFKNRKVLRRANAVRGRGIASFGKFSGFHASTTTGRNPLAALTQGVVNLAKDLFTTSFYATP